MRKTLVALAVGALLLAACAPSTQPLEDKIAKVETQAKTLEGKVSTVESQAKAVETQAKALEGKLGKVSIASGERLFVVTGLEYKGSTSTKDLAAPDVDPTKLSDGYRYKAPGKADPSDATKWEVSTYRFEPGFMVATQGDKITLLTFIVNGDKHTVWVQAPDGKEAVKQATLNRGREAKITFTAEQAGFYKFICEEHDPTMQSHILVLPR